eukprot:Sspe_Gene.119205::Locus_114536_Transcript_1_1_Confidence_1.000_Length_382::g.119205::m.119205
MPKSSGDSASRSRGSSASSSSSSSRSSSVATEAQADVAAATPREAVKEATSTQAQRVVLALRHLTGNVSKAHVTELLAQWGSPSVLPVSKPVGTASRWCDFPDGVARVEFATEKECIE